MAKGEIVIIEKLCRSCGYCAKYCPKGCIEMSATKLSDSGQLLPVVVKAESCVACATCANMCPEFAIDVYRYTEKKAV